MSLTTTSTAVQEKARKSGAIARRLQAYSILGAWAVLIVIFCAALARNFLYYPKLHGDCQLENSHSAVNPGIDLRVIGRRV